MKTQLTVWIVDTDGSAIELGPDVPHKLHCEEQMRCAYPRCGCGPKELVLPGGLKESYEQQVNAAIAKGKGR